VTFEEYAEARLNALLRYAIMLTGDRELGQDIVQDVMIRAHGRWQQIESCDMPERYLRRAIVNAYVSWRRRWSVRNLVSFSSPPDRPAPESAHEDLEPSELWHRMSSLPPRQRAVVVLRFYEGFTDIEIGELMGCTVSTVRSQMSRALARLRAGMQSNHLQESR